METISLPFGRWCRRGGGDRTMRWLPVLLMISCCASRLLALQGTTITPVSIPGTSIRFSLYLPPDYANGAARYPVVYHLHGIGGTHDGNQIKTVPASHETAVAADLIEPAIIVFPDGYGDSFWADSANGSKSAESDVLAVIDFMDATYRTRAERKSRVIEGFSMGGFGAAKFAAKFPDKFCACVIYDGALLDWPEVKSRHPTQASQVFNNDEAYFDQYSPWYWTERNAATLRAGMPIRQVVGAIVGNNQAYRDLLLANAITPSYVETGAPHVVDTLLSLGGQDSWAFIGAAMGTTEPATNGPPGSVALTATPKTFIGHAGLYGLLSTNVAPGNSQVGTFLSHPDFAGVSVRTYWRDIEKAEDVYDWSYYDAMVAIAQAAGKKVILRLEAAWASPQWVLDAVGRAGGPLYQYYERHQVTTPDVKESMPAPWDATYLRHWENFIAAFGARYNANPAVAGVLVAGCSRSTEMYLPVPGDGGPDWKEAPFSYTPQKLTEAWIEVIDAYAAAFPDKPIGLSLSVPLANDGVVEAVAAYGATTYPWHFYAKISYWGNNNDPDYYPTAALRRTVDAYTHGGLEPAGAAEEDIAAGAINFALAGHLLGMFEVYLWQRDNFSVLKTAIDARREMIAKLNFGAASGSETVRLSWTMAVPALHPQGIRILRRTDGFPAGIGDAEAAAVFDGGGSGETADATLPAGKIGWYSVYDKVTGYTLAQAKAKAEAGPRITSAPLSKQVPLGGATALTVSIAGDGPFAYQWRRNGEPLPGANGPELAFANFQPSDAGVYAVAVTNASGTVLSDGAIVGVAGIAKVAGAAVELEPANIRHANGRIFDQVLLTGAAATVTADPGQITRLSFVDLNDDIVQVEFAGAGALTVTLTGATGPAAPVNYSQTGVAYMRGHATLTIVGADETTNVSVFSVGKLTAFDPTGIYDFTQPAGATNNPANSGSPLFKPGIDYDGIADMALLSIASANGKFGGIRCANAQFFATAGLTGLNLPDVEVVGPVNVFDVCAYGEAAPVLLTGAVGAVTVAGGGIGVTGGDMRQDNGASVQVGGVQHIAMLAGVNSHNLPLPAQANRARYLRNGADVTAALVIDP